MKRFKVINKIALYINAKDKNDAQYKYIMRIINHINLTSSDNAQRLVMIDDLKIEELPF